MGNIQFTSAEFAKSWSHRPRLRGDDWQHGLESLFEFSVINYSTSGDGGGESKYVLALSGRARASMPRLTLTGAGRLQGSAQPLSAPLASGTATTT
jgi:hypothetical protein